MIPALLSAGIPLLTGSVGGLIGGLFGKKDSEVQTIENIFLTL